MLPTTFSRVWNLSPLKLNQLRREFENAVEHLGESASHATQQLPLTAWETTDGVTLELDVPGMAEADLSVAVNDGVLTVRGRRPIPRNGERPGHCERRYGEFTRSVHLDDCLDAASVVAEIGQGVLTISITRRAETQPRQIPIVIRSGQAVSSGVDAGQSDASNFTTTNDGTV